MLKKRQRDSMARIDQDGHYDYLRAEVASRIVDRLRDVSREFPLALDLGAHAGHLYRACATHAGVGGIKHLVQTDLSEAALLRASAHSTAALETDIVVADEEFLPFAPCTFDLVLRYGVL
jgi:NADH dehydrogenase [ubiquinone] 1 alpha subcomplex assembly factor 5